jgi:hypothetical protein
MPNTLLTISQITRKAAMTLHQKSTLLRTINRQYDEEFGRSGRKIGDTLRVRMPNQYQVRTGITHTPVDIVEESVNLPVATVRGVDLAFTSQEMTLSLDDFSERIIEPAMSVLAANIEADFHLNMARRVANVVDNDTAAFGFNTLNAARQVLTENLAPPAKRYAVLSPSHATRFINDTKGLFHSSSNIAEQYEEGMIGRTAGFDVMESTIIADHQTGTAAKTTGYLSNGVGLSGAAIAVDTGTTTLLIGDVVTFAGVFEVHPETKVSTGVLKQFVITANSGTSATSLAISPAIVATGPRQNASNTVADNSAVVKVGAGANERINGSLAYYRDAFTFVTADLPMPNGTDMASKATVDGITVSLVRDFNITSRDFPCRLDVLYGFAALRPQLACRIHADG